MPIYTLYHQVRRLNETLCGSDRKYSTGDVLFSGHGKRIVLGESIAEGGGGFRLHCPCSIGNTTRCQAPSSNATDALA